MSKKPAQKTNASSEPQVHTLLSNCSDWQKLATQPSGSQTTDSRKINQSWNIPCGQDKQLSSSFSSVRLLISVYVTARATQRVHIGGMSFGIKKLFKEQKVSTLSSRPRNSLERS